MASRRDVLRVVALGGAGGLSGCSGVGGLLGGGEEFEAEPANPDLITPGRDVLDYLHDLRGEGMMAGQEENDDSVDAEQSYIESVTGSKPALRGFDVADYIVDPMDEAQRSWEEDGQLVTFSWHVGAPPLDDSDFQHTFESTSAEEILTEGTEKHDVWMGKLETMAGRLRQLADAEVPVLWRPFHEADGGWFWWGQEGAEQFKRLWTHMYDYFVGEQELHNLLWVYSKSHDPTGPEWYPGDDYVDVAGVDTYDAYRNWNYQYDRVAEMSGDKPVALTETDRIPHPDVVEGDRYPFIWFLPWHTKHVRENPKSHIKEVYDHEYTVTAADLPEF